MYACLSNRHSQLPVSTWFPFRLPTPTYLWGKLSWALAWYPAWTAYSFTHAPRSILVWQWTGISFEVVWGKPTSTRFEHLQHLSQGVSKKNAFALQAFIITCAPAKIVHGGSAHRRLCKLWLVWEYRNTKFWLHSGLVAVTLDSPRQIRTGLLRHGSRKE